MANAPIAFESHQGQYNFEGVAQLVNAYAEKRGADAKAPLSVLPAPGIITLVDSAPGSCRGLLYLEDLDKLYSIHPSSCYRITYDSATDTATATNIGIVPGTDNVHLSRNQNSSPQVFIQSDLSDIVLSTDSLTPITDADYPTDVVTADYVHGYTIAGRPNRVFNISGLNESLTWDGLDFATFEQQAGKLIRVAESSGELVGFCSRWMEFWRDVGEADFPFAPIASRNVGLKSNGTHAVVRCDNTLMFPGHDNTFYRLNNYDPQRISMHTVERILEADTSTDDIYGFSWNFNGHKFANFTGTDWSRCYDAATQVWHTRQSYGYDTWRAKFSAQAWGRTIVGDAISGKLGYLDADTFTEYGEPMIWGVDSPPLHVFPHGAIVDAFHMDLATGYGTLSGQGSNPKIMLEVSKDGGNTFQQYRELELGITGHYATRVTARRLGKFGPKGIVFRLRISDPIVRALVATDIQLRPLKR